MHPFPSMLNGAAAAAMVIVAGGEPPTALRLGVAMVCLQAAIGTVNDLADADRDAGHDPPKAIPAGLVSIGTARGIAAAAVVVGLVLVVPSGAATFGVAVAGLACGLVYDLWLSRTPLSWLPLAVALPLVPAYAWLGATGVIPQDLLAVLPIAGLAGAGLAVGNALVDLESDRAAGRRTIAVVLGRARAWLLHAAALVVAAVLLAWRMPLGADTGAVVAVGAGLLVLTGASLAAGLTYGPWRRLAWQAEAAGVAAIGVGWVFALAGGSA